MEKIELKELVTDILVPVASGTVIGIMFKDYTSSIEEFNRNIVVPPIVFPIVWSILYFLIGIWFYFFGMEASTKKKILYYVLLGLNLLFTPVLFYFKNIPFAFVITLMLLVGNTYLFFYSIRINKKGYILLPYLIWLIVANVLMIDLLVNNVL
jgi:tryptophan-rich sensory protein